MPNMFFAEVAGGVSLVQRARETAVGQVELAADVDERIAHLQRIRGDQHRLEQQVRRFSRIQRSLKVPGSPSSALAHR